MRSPRRPPDLSCTDSVLNEEETTCRQRARIEDYLDHLCAPLVGSLPYARRQEIRREAEAHLYASIEEHREMGLSVERATEAALQAYGAPYRLAQAILDTWYSGAGSRTRPALYSRTATLRAFACFSIPTAISALLVESYAPTDIGLERSLWMGLWLLVSPLLAGALTGRMVPVRSAQAVANVMLLLLLHGTVAAFLMLPRRDGFYFVLFQLLYSLPVGALTAFLTQVICRHLRRTAFRTAYAR